MGGVTLVDDWLLDLQYAGRAAGNLAGRLLLVQIRVQQKRGHIMDLHSEYPRTQLSKAARQGKLPDVVVRCLRCNHKAWYRDWEMSARLGDLGAADLIAHYRCSIPDADLAYLCPCEGEVNAEGVEALADSLVRWEG